MKYVAVVMRRLNRQTEWIPSLDININGDRP